MTEEQLERYVEHRMDRLDERLIRDELEPEDYNRAVEALCHWAEQQMRRVA